MAATQPPKNLMEKAAKTMVENDAMVESNHIIKDGEYYSLLKRRGCETWMEVYERLIKMHTQPCFTKIIGKCMGHGNKKNITQVKRRVIRSDLITSGNLPVCYHEQNFALCQEVMSAGKHFVNFRVTDAEMGVFVGVMRPVMEWDHKTSKPGGLTNLRHWRVHDNCGYYRFCREKNQEGEAAYAGQKHHFFYHALHELTDRELDFRRMLEMEISHNKVIGLLLDLDEGKLQVWSNGRYQGVKEQGLRGHFRWAVSYTAAGRKSLKTTVSINPAPLPT